jgi:dihydrofolate reductase
MKIALIAAVARNRVIGRDNQLLWRIKPDLRHFRDLTVGKPVIMGRKTFESIGRPLPGRDNIVLTRDTTFETQGIFVVRTLEEAFVKASELGKSSGAKEIMIAGGGNIYAQTMDRADRLYITEVDLTPDGDAIFPEIVRKKWKEIRRDERPRGAGDDAAYAFVDYERVK